MSIPKIGDKELSDLCARIKPVARYLRNERKKFFASSDGDLYYIKDVHPRNASFTWDPEPTVRASGLEELAQITTQHSYGYYGFFKPSIDEVMAQIPKRYIDKVVAFETTNPSINGSTHAATTILYEKG